MSRALLVALALSGCPKPVPAPTPPPAMLGDFGLADCPASTPMPVTSGVCSNKITATGLRCVACQVTAPCLYREAVVYCTTNCGDSACAPGL